MSTVVSLPPQPADIPAMLRMLADEIDGGQHPDLRFVIAVLVDDKGRVIENRGWGQCSPLEAIGALTVAAGKLARR
jgi:hypothetical protein